MIAQFEYKGFNIYQLTSDCFAPQNKGDAKFKPDGYVSLNAAKGAITKYLTQRDKEYDEIKAEREKQKPMSLGDILRMKLDQMEKEKSVPKSRNKREGRFTGKVDGLFDRSVNWSSKELMSVSWNARNRKQRKGSKIFFMDVKKA